MGDVSMLATTVAVADAIASGVPSINALYARLRTVNKMQQNPRKCCTVLASCDAAQPGGAATFLDNVRQFVTHAHCVDVQSKGNPFEAQAQLVYRMRWDAKDRLMNADRRNDWNLYWVLGVFEKSLFIRFLLLQYQRGFNELSFRYINDSYVYLLPA